ncbi:MAG: thioredoxin family protein [Acidimicrobiales bacterium]
MSMPELPEVRLLYLPDCPHWRLAEARLKEALRRIGADPEAVVCQQMATADQAEGLRFRGSPTILVGVRDPFAGPEDAGGLACRIYWTGREHEPAPSVEQLVGVLRP